MKFYDEYEDAPDELKRSNSSYSCSDGYCGADDCQNCRPGNRPEDGRTCDCEDAPCCGCYDL